MIRISITGPESSGKTELSEWLANQWPSTLLLPEFAREYLLSKPDYRYSSEDVVYCAEQTHLQMVDAMNSTQANVLICDTDFYVLDIWHEVVFGYKHPRILELKAQHDFDIYLLCRPDLPWQYDPLRENEYDRDRLYQMYANALNQDRKQVLVVAGEGMARFERVRDQLQLIFPAL